MSNTAGATSYDVDGKLASEVRKATGIEVLPHAVKKPGCGDEIMSYFRQHPETGVTGPHQIAIVGDRLATDMMLANMMGSWGIWVKDGVIPLQQKSIVSPRNGVFPDHPAYTSRRLSSQGLKGGSGPPSSRGATLPPTHSTLSSKGPIAISDGDSPCDGQLPAQDPYSVQYCQDS